MPRPDDAGDLADDVFAFEGVVVAEGWADGELYDCKRE